jgi:hypothetical protein
MFIIFGGPSKADELSTAKKIPKNRIVINYKALYKVFLLLKG